MDAALLLALALSSGAALALAPGPTLVAAVVALFALRRRASRSALVFAVLALVLAGLRARARLEQAERTHARAVGLVAPPVRCVGEGVVSASPVVRTSDSTDALGDARLELELDAGSCGDRAIDGPFRVRVEGGPRELARGDRVYAVLDLAPVHLFANRELADARAGIARSGVAASGGVVDLRVLQRAFGVRALVDRARAFVRRRIEASYPRDAAALGRALVLGEADLDPRDDEAFRTSGLSHLLAVSGTHLVLAVLSVAAALRALLVRVEPLAARLDVARVVAALTIPIAWIYADFAGGSGSAWRAAAMLTAAQATVLFGRRPNGVRAFAVSLVGAALVDPLVITDVSFALSVGATAGLLFLKAPIASRVVRGPGFVKPVLEAIATTAAAMVGCTPFLAVIAPTLPILGILANLIAAPLGELAALPLCLVHAALGWAPAAERGAALGGAGALLGVRAVARLTSATGWVVHLPPPTNAQLAALAAGAIVLGAAATARARHLTIALILASIGALEGFAIREGAPHGELRASVLDVGQGDSSIVDLPSGAAMLIDGGGFVGSPVDTGLRVLLPVLRARRRHRVDVVVLSHPHPDHFGGLVSALPELEVGEVWDTGQGEAQGAGDSYARLIAGLRARGVPIRRPAELCGEPRALGGATVRVLAPCPSFEPDLGANDNSLVLRITANGRTALFVGDAEEHEEKALLATRPDELRADFLKVGHHGSRTSTSRAFLDAVHPSWAAISTGVRNRFGHPHPRTLATLEAARVPFLRTDHAGEIVWEALAGETTIATTRAP